MISKKYFVLVVFFLISCSAHHTPKPFLYKKAQKQHKRIVKSALTVVDSLNLSLMHITSAGWIRQNKKDIFISNNVGIFEIAALNKHNFKEDFHLHFMKGKGPKELVNFMDFDVRDSLLVLIDENQRKMEFRQLPNHFIKDVIMPDPKVIPHRLQILNSNRFLFYSPGMSSNFLFNIVDSNGKRISDFQNVKSGQNMFADEGEIREVNHDIYYAGFSEPILKKFTLKGKLDYSVSAIDNYNTKFNYITTQGENQKVMGYAPGALFSTIDFDIFKNKWYVLQAPNGNHKISYLDIYNAKNGNYLASFKLKPLTFQICVDKQYIYTIEKKEENDYLVVYKNNVSLELK
jgi:hypothetical protein